MTRSRSEHTIDLPGHRAHDYAYLVQRWRAVARAAGLRVRAFAETHGVRLFYLKTPALRAENGIYISAGIHGDEPGASEGLIGWAEKHGAALRDLPLLLFPCLNPVGLVNNTRADGDGRDLNRLFHTDTSNVVNSVKDLAAPHRFALALMLHEDYDAQGAYLYEVQRETPYWGESLLETVRGILPIEPRTRIDGRLARGGLVRRRFDRKRFEAMGYPEAIYLHDRHAQRSLTFETPSEFALQQRTAAHIAVIEECVRRVRSACVHSTQTPR